MPLVKAYSGHSHIDAMIVRGLFASAGLHAVVPGEELLDEFAGASKAMGGMAEVFVPEDELDDALRLLAEREGAQ
jgi:hypothetical protein